MSMIQKTGVILKDARGKRLDVALSELFKDYSRSQLQSWLLDGKITVDGEKLCVPKYKVKGGEQIIIEALRPQIKSFEGECIPLDIVYEDEAVLVLNKPSDLVVHPGAGQYHGTLLNALLYHEPLLKQVPRAGIIHRLDKETTGLMVVAKTLESQFNLTNQLKARSIRRVYHTCVWGNLLVGFTANLPIGRHPRNRLQMAVQPEGFGKEATTHFKVLKKWGQATYLEARLETGRTHQIRVHLAHHHYPVIGDPVYGLKHRNGSVQAYIKRQALHAKELSFVHPLTGEICHFSVDLPEDMKQLIAFLDYSAPASR